MVLTACNVSRDVVVRQIIIDEIPEETVYGQPPGSNHPEGFGGMVHGWAMQL